MSIEASVCWDSEGPGSQDRRGRRVAGNIRRRLRISRLAGEVLEDKSACAISGGTHGLDEMAAGHAVELDDGDLDARNRLACI